MYVLLIEQFIIQLSDFDKGIKHVEPKIVTFCGRNTEIKANIQLGKDICKGQIKVWKL